MSMLTFMQTLAQKSRDISGALSLHLKDTMERLCSQHTFVTTLVNHF